MLVLLLSDGIMCGLTGVSWLVQRLVYHRILDWDRSGWILQSVSKVPPRHGHEPSPQKLRTKSASN